MAILRAARRKAFDNLAKTSMPMKVRYDKRCKVATEYKAGYFNVGATVGDKPKREQQQQMVLTKLSRC